MQVGANKVKASTATWGDFKTASLLYCQFVLFLIQIILKIGSIFVNIRRTRGYTFPPPQFLGLICLLCVFWGTCANISRQHYCSTANVTHTRTYLHIYVHTSAWEQEPCLSLWGLPGQGQAPSTQQRPPEPCLLAPCSEKARSQICLMQQQPRVMEVLEHYTGFYSFSSPDNRVTIPTLHYFKVSVITRCIFLDFCSCCLAAKQHKL